MPSRKDARHGKVLFAMTLGFTLAAMIIQALGPAVFANLDYLAQDFVARHSNPAPEDPRLVFIGIDAESQSLSTLRDEDINPSPALTIMKQGWPFRRTLYPLIYDRLFQAGARSVVLDMRFPGSKPADAGFSAALERYRDRVVIGFNFPEKEDRMGMISSVEWPPESLVGDPRFSDPRVGYVNVWPDADEVVRGARYRTGLMQARGLSPMVGEDIFESLAARAMRQSGHRDLIPDDTEPRTIRFASWGKERGSGFEPHSLFEIFTPFYWEHNYGNGAFFEGKIVLVGPSGSWSKDVVRTPFGLIAGPLYHMNAMNALLTRSFLDRPPLAVTLLLVAGGGLFALAIGWFIRRPLFRGALAIASVPGWFWCAVAFYNSGWLVPVLSPMLAAVSSSGAFLLYEHWTERVARLRIRRTLEGYVSKDVVREVLDNPESFLHTADGMRRCVAILFSDVRGFTALTEEADPAKLVAQLNEYFTEMVRIVFAHGGTVDKFIGDAVMAHWGGTVVRGAEHDACAAVAAGLDMLEAVRKLNAGWTERGMTPFKIGLGINYGEVIVGNIGSEEKHEFTAIGDPINLASRLEGATKEFRIDLLLGESAAPLVRGRYDLRSVDLLQVSGKSRPVQVFTVVGARQQAQEPGWLTAYEEGLRHYRNCLFEEALLSFKRADEAHPNDWLTEEYIRRCQAFAITPPPPDWNGVYIMKTK